MSIAMSWRETILRDCTSLLHIKCKKAASTVSCASETYSAQIYNFTFRFSAAFAANGHNFEKTDQSVLAPRMYIELLLANKAPVLSACVVVIDECRIARTRYEYIDATLA